MPRARAAGFTLLELLMVVALIATASALVTLSLPDPDRAVLERDGQRLAALLDSARAQSRASGRPVFWRAIDGGFRFEGMQPSGQAAPGPRPAMRWLDGDVRIVQGAGVMQLGPEPIIAAQGVVLGRGSQRLQIDSDGLRPFAVTLLP